MSLLRLGNKKALALIMGFPHHHHSPISLPWLWGKQAAMCFTTVLHNQCHLLEREGNCKYNHKKNKTMLLNPNKTRLSPESSKSKISLFPLSVLLFRRDVIKT